MTVYNNIAFPLRSPARSPRLTEPEIKALVQRIATMLQIDHLLERAPSQLSGGQRQRTSLGRMLVRQPRAFLMDEPIVHLDAKLRHHMRGELKQLHEQFRVSTLYATPDWMEAVAMGHRIAVLHQGRVMQIGTPDEIYHTPVNRFVADFVGEPPMNILNGGLVHEDGRLQFDLGGIRMALGDDLEHAIKHAGATEWELGLRPNAIRLTQTQVDPSSLPATVYVSEPLGRDTIIEAQLANQPVAVKVSGLMPLKPETRIWLDVDVKQLHAFDRRTGGRLRVDSERQSAPRVDSQ